MLKSVFNLAIGKAISVTAGKLANHKFAPKILHSFINCYSFIYKIDLKESKRKKVSTFNTFNDFFTRDADFSKRKVDNKPNSVVSPVDGKVISFGKIQKNLFYQAKGISFLLEELVGDENKDLFLDGYQISIYLGPADHHRIYAPCDGKIENFSYFSGRLFPVNSLGLKFLPNLFCVNERILSLLNVNSQKNTVIGILKIGAMVVGSIKTKYKSIPIHQEKDNLSVPVYPAFSVKKSEEIAHFELGSMVQLLFPKNSFSTEKFELNSKIKIGQKLGDFVTSNSKAKDK